MKHFTKKRVEELLAAKLPEPALSARQWEVFLEGVVLFNGRKFWEAHEKWEVVWKQREEDSRIFFQGIIQAAAGLHLLLAKRRYGGARRNFEKALEKLGLFSGRFLGVDVNRLRAALTAAKVEMERLGEERLGDFPEALTPRLDVHRERAGS
jgi:predicted metal-dependent hydrolase